MTDASQPRNPEGEQLRFSVHLVALITSTFMTFPTNTTTTITTVLYALSRPGSHNDSSGADSIQAPPLASASGTTGVLRGRSMCMSMLQPLECWDHGH